MISDAETARLWQMVYRYDDTGQGLERIRAYVRKHILPANLSNLTPDEVKLCHALLCAFDRFRLLIPRK